MNTILAPTATTATTSTADQIIEALATYVDEHGGDTGGGHQRTMLLAAILTRLFDLPAGQAIEMAKHDAFDERVRAAGDARDEILNRVHRARLAREQAWMPTPGDQVTHTGTDGIWVISGYESPDTVWIHRPDARKVPTIGHAAAGMVDLGGWQDRPEDELLAVVAELRPADAPEVTV